MTTNDTPQSARDASDPYAAPGAAVEDNTVQSAGPRVVVATVLASVAGAALIVLGEYSALVFTFVHRALAMLALGVLPTLWVLAPAAHLAGGWRRLPVHHVLRTAGVMALAIGTLTFLLSVAGFFAWAMWMTPYPP